MDSGVGVGLRWLGGGVDSGVRIWTLGLGLDSEICLGLDSGVVEVELRWLGFGLGGWVLDLRVEVGLRWLGFWALGLGFGLWVGVWTRGLWMDSGF